MIDLDTQDGGNRRQMFTRVIADAFTVLCESVSARRPSAAIPRARALRHLADGWRAASRTFRFVRETAAEERKNGCFLRLEALRVAAQLSLGQRQRPPLKKGTPEGAVMTLAYHLQPR
jgi:hypothetical protein